MTAEHNHTTLRELADWCQVISGSIHDIHFAIVGDKGQELHAEITDPIYSMIQGWYDRLVERSICYGEPLADTNFAANRVNIAEHIDQKLNYDEGIKKLDDCLDVLWNKFVAVHDDACWSGGTMNMLEDMMDDLEIWYFYKVKKWQNSQEEE
jgi:DNA-binding ferritin-like protein